jgi:hypothetical protein
MTLRFRLSFVAVLAASVLLPLPASAQKPAAGPNTTRTVYVNAFDQNGAPVADLVTEDFEVKEGGKSRDVVISRPAKALMQIALIVDDNGTGIFRAPLYRFVQRLQGHAEFAIISVVGQPM